MGTTEKQMKDNGTGKEKLRFWQERLAKNETAYSDELDKMDRRESLYKGDNRIEALVDGDKTTKTPHVRNICSELIEAQIDSVVPKPKVTARRKCDEGLAKLIEDMLLSEIDRLPCEIINDMCERTVPIQGGAMILLEWDSTKRTPISSGELALTALHPKKVIPQDGVYSGIEDMDYIIIKLPTSKAYIERKYGIKVEDESGEEPEIRSSDAESSFDDLVTQYLAYHRNEKGGIGLFSWVCDTVLCDYDDYQARRLPHCKKCGEVTTDEVCPVCGGTDFAEKEEEFEIRRSPIRRSDGIIYGGKYYPDGGKGMNYDEYSAAVMTPTVIPAYKPNIYPVILIKNVSVFGKLLGDSDIDKIEDQQNTINRLECKIIDKIVKSGSYITLPRNADIKVDTNEMKTIRVTDPADKAMIDVFTMEGAISADMNYLASVYEEARQVIGITNSLQGREDSTATSAVAKEFSAKQAAGRLESKRVMKDAAYAALFEAMFKFKLAYADEPRSIISRDIYGNAEYKEFNRYDFLKQDEKGNWYWDDDFLFSCDTSTPLSTDRQAMWQETRMNLQSGAFGNPADIMTLILFWSKMETLHYPGAAETKTYLEEQMRRQNETAQGDNEEALIADAVMKKAAQDAEADAYAQSEGR